MVMPDRNKSFQWSFRGLVLGIIPHFATSHFSRILCRLNGFLDNVDVGDMIVQGELEAFSCKLMLFF